MGYSSPLGFPGGSVGKEPACNAGDTGGMGSIPRLGRSFGGGHGNSLQYSCLENPTDRGAWWDTVQRVTKSQTQLKLLSKALYSSLGSNGISLGYSK